LEFLCLFQGLFIAQTLGRGIYDANAVAPFPENRSQHQQPEMWKGGSDGSQIAISFFKGIWGICKKNGSHDCLTFITFVK
jgi:hypothetical protein